MKIVSVTNSSNTGVPAFNAALRVTDAAKNKIFESKVDGTLVPNLVFTKSMKKFSQRLVGEFPFSGDVFFDTISNATKSATANKNSQYEIRIFGKAVDYHFDHNRIYDNRMPYNKCPIEEKIEQESNMQANYLYDTYLYLKNKISS